MSCSSSPLTPESHHASSHSSPNLDPSEKEDIVDDSHGPDQSGDRLRDASTLGVRHIVIPNYGHIAWSYGRQSLRVVCGHHRKCEFNRSLKPHMHRTAQGRPLGLMGLFLMKAPDFVSARRHKRWLAKHKHRQRRRIRGRTFLASLHDPCVDELFGAERLARSTEAAEPRKCP